MRRNVREPDFAQFMKVLSRRRPDRPVLFELFMNYPLYELASGMKAGEDAASRLKTVVSAFSALGYDYATAYGCDMSFSAGPRAQAKTISLNEGYVITDQASFDAYEWPDPDKLDYSRLDAARGFLPDGMKLMVMGPGGVLENAITLTGYDNLCYMLYEDEPLARAIFDGVGSRLVRYYENAASFGTVGVLMSNDDWGFNTQTFLPPAMTRKYVFPWHKKIVQVAHDHKLPALLHSCGNLSEVMEDVIEDMGYDGKHSFEDNILPIEQAYERWGGRIALLGGIDVDFLIRSPEDAIRARCRAMLERASAKGGYALGSGNSIPEYIPVEKYLSMIECAY